MYFPELNNSWLNSTYHHDWVEQEGRRLLAFYRNAVCPLGGFAALDIHGKLPAESQPDTMLTARMTHCYALASLKGEPGAHTLAKWGVESLLNRLQDTEHGGWFAGLPEQSHNQPKTAYLHVFVTLAACNALLAGIEGADRLFTQATDILMTHFWQEDEGALAESFSCDWEQPADYRGGNSNMHCTELFLQLADVTEDSVWRKRALAIVDRVIHQHAPANGYLLAEHFHGDWQEWHDFNRDKVADDFYPYGVTPGHSCEWSRLLIHLEAALHAKMEPVPGWLLEDAKGLFEVGIRYGWQSGDYPGFVYTHDWDKLPVVENRIHWTIAESCAAASSLLKRTGDTRYEYWYRRLWDYIAIYLIDTRHGSWWHELDARNQPSDVVWSGKPDLYHAWQLTQICRLPLYPMIGKALEKGVSQP
jgi:N-acyl-D-glucosamine 2-epimerase